MERAISDALTRIEEGWRDLLTEVQQGTRELREVADSLVSTIEVDESYRDYL